MLKKPVRKKLDGWQQSNNPKDASLSNSRPLTREEKRKNP
jgi:hypothetical protein